MSGTSMFNEAMFREILLPPLKKKITDYVAHTCFFKKNFSEPQ